MIRFTDLRRNDQFAILALGAFLLIAAGLLRWGSAFGAEPLIEHPGQRCPTGEAGCYVQAQHAIYYTDELAREHELEHAVGGMRHSEWTRLPVGTWVWTCAKVLVAGTTHWRIGEWICRTPHGEYVSGGA